MRKTLDWIKRHPFLAATLGLVLALVALHFVGDALAERRWQAYCEEARARGTILRIEGYAPPSVPDAENFAAAPIVAGAFAVPAARNPFTLPSTADRSFIYEGFARRLPEEWDRLQTHFYRFGWLETLSEDPAGDIWWMLESRFASAVRDWDAALERPQTSFPVSYPTGWVKDVRHTSLCHGALELFLIRFHAQLDRGNAAAAYSEWKRMLVTFQRMTTPRIEPLNWLVQGRLRDLTEAAVLGQKEGVWTDAELHAIERDLASLDLRLALQAQQDFVRVTANRLYDDLAAAPAWKRAKLPSPGLVFQQTFDTWMHTFTSRRMIRDNQLRTNRYLDELQARAQPDGTYEAGRPTPSQLGADPQMGETIHYYLFGKCEWELEYAERKWVRLQTRADHLRIACTLERFRRARGEYPQQLAELVPEWMSSLPQDPYAPGPYRYRRESKGGYHLYGVGRDGVDNGGVHDPSNNDFLQKDVIWRVDLPPR